MSATETIDQSKDKKQPRLGVFMWFAVEDLPAAVNTVQGHGQKIGEWDEDPNETGDPYTHVGQYSYLDCDIELFYVGDAISDVRAFVPISEDQRSELHEEQLPAANFHLNQLGLGSHRYDTSGIHFTVPQITSPNLKLKYVQLMGRAS